MKIELVEDHALSGILILKFARFNDHRGYFTEHFRESDIQKIIPNFTILQCNESYSLPGTIRGLHFQWNPHMGKLIRTVSGRMIDIFLDIRLGSPTFGKIGMYDMCAVFHTESTNQEWIWIPPGFAHGNVFLETTKIEYLCTGEYSQGCECGISPFSMDIDWSLVSKDLKDKFDKNKESKLITDKDRNGLTLEQWLSNKNSREFIWKN